VGRDAAVVKEVERRGEGDVAASSALAAMSAATSSVRMAAESLIDGSSDGLPISAPSMTVMPRSTHAKPQLTSKAAYSAEPSSEKNPTTIVTSVKTRATSSFDCKEIIPEI